MKSAFVFLVSFWLVPAAMAECGIHKLPAGQQASSASFQVGYVPNPSTIAVSEHFSVILEICKKDGTPFAGTPVVDAHMPMHRHGMNYRPQVEKLSGGKFRADGLLFHMPGKWQFKFDIQDGDSSERVTLDYMLK